MNADRMQAALDQASRVVAGVSDDQLALSTPCTDFDVRVLARHMVRVARRIAGIGRREPQAGEVDTNGIPEDVDGLTKAFDEARHDAYASWADDAILSEELVLPFATLPGAAVADIYTLELTAHTWDLAVATGQLDVRDPGLAEASLDIARRMLPPEPRGGDFPFEAVVPVPDDVPPYDRLGGYLGRRPLTAFGPRRPDTTFGPRRPDKAFGPRGPVTA